MKKLIICEKSSLAKGVISGINTMSYGDKMKTIEYYKGKDALSSLYYYENNDYIVTAVVGNLFELTNYLGMILNCLLNQIILILKFL